jgi:predicted metalloprotease with PDZ domain
VVLLALYCSAAWAQSPETAIRLEVDIREAPRGILHAKLAIPVQSGPLTLRYPKWIPGEHGPTGPVSDLVGLKILAGGRADGREVPWRRDLTDMYAFHCEVPPGVQSLEVSLDFLTPIDGSGFTAGASTSPFLAVLSWNQVVLYPGDSSAADLVYTPRLILPEGWKFGAALQVRQEDGGVVEFQPVSLERLVDSPLIAGRYFREISLGDADGRPHALAIVADSEQALEMKPDVEAALRRLITEGGALFGARHYDRYKFLLTLSDHVAHFGLEHHESSDNRLPGDTLSGDRGAAALGSLLPHEYVHSWNGKYRRPEGLATARFDEPMETDMLWVYEGLTSYLGYVLAARSGLWSAEEFRERITQRAAALDHRAGRTWRSLQDTASSAQLLFDARRSWGWWRRGTDFYDEAALVWLEADIMLRQKSNGRYSLNDFARRFYGGSSGGPSVVTYTLQDIVAALAEMVPDDWNEFFVERLTSTAPQAPLGGIQGSGWRLIYRESANGDGDDGPPGSLQYSLGMSVAGDGRIADVSPDGPAGRAGLAPDWRIIAVNGREYSGDVIRRAVRDAEHSTEPIELLVENREFLQTYRVDYHEGERFPALERDSSKPDLLQEIIRPMVE